MADTTRRVLLAGATGLVGSEVLRLLLADPTVSRVIALSRRPLPDESHKLEARVVDFDVLEASRDVFAVDQVICALGTTIRQAGSQHAFRRVDHDYPIAIAKLALEAGARHYLLVSALGANADSRVFYNRVKGEVEQALRAMPFRSLTIARPSLLLGDRAERRFGEEVGKRIGWLLPKRFRPVHARDVAAAIVAAARDDEVGVRVIESIDFHPRRHGSAIRS